MTVDGTTIDRTALRSRMALDEVLRDARRASLRTAFNAGTLDNQTVEFNRTVHGPVVGYATVNGRRVAVSRKRSSYLLDGVDLLLFRKLTRDRKSTRLNSSHSSPSRMPSSA